MEIISKNQFKRRELTAAETHSVSGGAAFLIPLAKVAAGSFAGGVVVGAISKGIEVAVDKLNGK